MVTSATPPGNLSRCQLDQHAGLMTQEGYTAELRLHFAHHTLCDGAALTKCWKAWYLHDLAAVPLLVPVLYSVLGCVCHLLDAVVVNEARLQPVTSTSPLRRWKAQHRSLIQSHAEVICSTGKHPQSRSGKARNYAETVQTSD